MEALFLKLVNMSITASWLVLAIIAVRLIFKKIPKWILCLLWGFVAMRLICPFSIESALSLIPNPEPLPQEIIYTAHPEIQSGVPVIDSTVNPMLEFSMTPMEPASANPTQIWSFILSQVWILGMVLMLLYTIISYLRLKRKVAAAIPLCRGLKQSEFVDSPFVLGILRPVIYLPFGMAEADMAYVIAHEKAHIRRRDHWWKPFGFLLLSIYWFNPVLWVAYILLCRDIEAACDEKVIKDMERNDRRAYSRALLNCSIHHRRIAACPLAFGEVGVKARVKGVMNYKKPAFWVILIALIVSVIVAVCFLTNPERSMPDNMTLVYFDRTMAYVKFHYEEDLEYQIREEFTLETLKDGNWQELPRLTEKQAANEIGIVTSEDVDHDAWSILKWEDVYGRLPDGSYRIHKDITKNANSDAYEIEPFYVEFTIGGTAEEYITYTLEDITATGANLYEHEKIDDSFAIIYNNDGFWLESLQDGQWKYLEPTEDVHSVIPKEKYYIHELHYPSSHIELDWSDLYGALPDGAYRIAREITHTGGSDLCLCTAYVEFSINNNVYTWFDRYSENASDYYPKETIVNLTGTEGKASYDASKEQISIITAEGNTPVISSEVNIRSAFITDLTGDGISEICATVQTETGMVVQVYDPEEKQLYQYPGDENGLYFLSNKADRLCILSRSDSWNLDEYGLLAVVKNPVTGERKLEVLEIDSTLEPLTRTISCVDINNRKHVCITNPQEIEKMMQLLQDLKQQVTSASEADLKEAKNDSFNSVAITINYQLGEKTIYFSRDYRLVWEYGSETGYALTNPEPLQAFAESITDGVRREETSGKPFASVEAPWDWCKNVGIDALESAQANICLADYSNGNSAGSFSTMGAISHNTLQELLSVLNQVPKDAFSPGRTIARENYGMLTSVMGAGTCKIAIIDGVNNLAVVFIHKDGKTEIVMTDEMEKVRDDSPTYLQPMQSWEIQDQALNEFMKVFIEHTPVITYFVGGEYDWQDTIPVYSEAFKLDLRLPEGWIYESVNNSDNSGIRCRPETENTGWIYFSFWPKGYETQETDRYINEGMHHGGPWYISYPAEVSQPGSLDVTGAIWSYQRICTSVGDYVIINDGADSWFPEYQDQIEDAITISRYSVE